MQHLNSHQIREKFLAYFQAHGHQVVPSSSLIPGNDPTLLFTNSGMVQFKDTFLGTEHRPYRRATSAQRCVRAGGKHNDLENVGYTRRHHTFFEMLGNFSFGDYFKREAIKFAWEFLTKQLGIPQEKLWVTVFEDDQESEAIWRDEMHVDPARITRCGLKDNFWQMGDTGPCGPCTEIFYDHGPSVAGGPPGSPDAEGDRYVEVWNVVFMQYERDAQGKLTPLPRPCVDTGMGLERICAVMQGVHDNYDIDIFQYLLRALARVLGVQDTQAKSMRVIVDHIRSTAFLMVDGVTPSNEGRGYVLRRIMRRAIRHGVMLGCTQPFFHQLVRPLVEVMGDAYPELALQAAAIEQHILAEEQQFAKTLSRGLKIFEQAVQGLAPGASIPGDVVFQLYDTYGFPPDLTADIARERGLSVDDAGFEACMLKQRAQSQQATSFSVDATQKVSVQQATRFLGYDHEKSSARVLAVLDERYQPLSSLMAGQRGIVVLDQTPFYAESGGQIGDIGCLAAPQGQFQVLDTQKQGDVFLHVGQMQQGQLAVATVVEATVDHAHRQAVRLNHSATHLLHAALRTILGKHVQQKGSLVAADRLRFDFSHPKALTEQEWQQVERWVNQAIRANHAGETTVSSPEAAKAAGAMAMFGERYGEEVRVLQFGAASTEICGGTHAQRTGDIGLFKLISEAACGAGIRRIEAVTGEAALAWVEVLQNRLQTVCQQLKVPEVNLEDRLQQLLTQQRELEREVQQLRQQHANRQLGQLGDQAQDLGRFKVLAAELKGVDRETLRSTLDQLKQSLGSAAIVLGTVQQDQVQLVAAVTPDCLPYFDATALLNQVAHQVGGKGGGRPEMAQGGGTDPRALSGALASVAGWARAKLSSE